MAELTDKDALLILTLATKTRAVIVFLAGASAFVFTTFVSVVLGSVVSSLIPILWVKLAGGVVMLAFGVREAKGIIGQKAIEEEEKRLEKVKDGARAFLQMFAALAILDLAGDATMILTVVLAAQYADKLFIFSSICLGLIAATAFETALGNRLGRMLTPRRLKYAASAVFITIGVVIIATSIWY
ncbi:MAG: TMEM165/GDT1 family protein [archaeon]|nr:MAG: TMEM165/GDT1 family protein [archaeon]